jgi:hypothetical protein
VRVELSLPSAAASATGGSLRELRRTDRGAAKSPLELAGVISAIDLTARTVTLSADGAGISKATIVLTAATPVDLRKIATQEPVVAHAVLSAAGAYTLTGATDDQGSTNADDLSYAVGDFKPGQAHTARLERSHRRAGTRVSRRAVDAAASKRRPRPGEPGSPPGGI